MTDVASRRIFRAGALAALGLVVPLPATSGTGAAPGEVALPSGPLPAAAPARPAPAPPQVEVQGTVEATLDGQRLAWYSVSGESGGMPYSSSSWMELAPSESMVAVGGFSSDDPPLESFTWDDSGMPTSYGTYDGSVLGLAIRLPAGQSSFTVTFPDDGGNSMSYQPRATLEDVMASTFMIAEGTLTVTRVEISGGLARAAGTFSGTFRTMTGGDAVEITDGVFDVQGIPSLETLRR